MNASSPYEAGSRGPGSGIKKLDVEEIVRVDFPIARRGYDPEAVRAHLVAVAETIRGRASTPLAARAGEAIAGIIEVAEQKAMEIEEEARRDAERAVAAAREEAKGQVERAEGAVGRLVKEADKLRAAVGTLGREITAELGGSKEADAEAAETGELAPEDEQEPLPPYSARRFAPPAESEAAEPSPEEDQEERPTPQAPGEVLVEQVKAQPDAAPQIPTPERGRRRWRKS